MNPTQYIKARGRSDARAVRGALPIRMRGDLIHREFNRLLRLPMFGHIKRFAHLKSIRRSRVKAHSTGRAWPMTGKIVLTLGAAADWPTICVLLCHELAHVAAPYRAHHNDRWRSIFVESVVGAYGIDEVPHPFCTSFDLHDYLALAVRLRLAA